MKIGDVITKEQFLKLAPLGLTALCSSPTDTLIGYCPKAAARFIASRRATSTEGMLELIIPGYILIDRRTKEAGMHIMGYWNLVNQGKFKIHTLPNIPLLKRKKQ